LLLILLRLLLSCLLACKKIVMTAAIKVANAPIRPDARLVQSGPAAISTTRRLVAKMNKSTSFTRRELPTHVLRARARTQAVHVPVAPGLQGHRPACQPAPTEALSSCWGAVGWVPGRSPGRDPFDGHRVLVAVQGPSEPDIDHQPLCVLYHRFPLSFAGSKI